MLQKQLELVTQILQLGAYSLPRMVLESEKVDAFFNDAIKKDLFRCNDEIRKGDKIIIVDASINIFYRVKLFRSSSAHHDNSSGLHES